MFAPGDKIKCVNAEEKTTIKNGEVYTVHSVDTDFVRIRTDDGELRGFWMYRFVSINQPSSIDQGAQEYDEIMALQETWNDYTA